ncbi:hypothetical protein MYVALT_F_03100 [Candidatus Vallotia tarda]|uniref:Uncharacterized protein n=1 Tax=Candidatus Vallotiella hemipterorum TaxID=1177213 RepID=A0A916JU21_9BURK|nr:hypothetical protein MYVALT_F_03100 [Candidatus Vallotia tarda]
MNDYLSVQEVTFLTLYFCHYIAMNLLVINNARQGVSRQPFILVYLDCVFHK